MKTDSTAAKQLFDGSAEKYARLQAQLKDPTAITGRSGGQYMPYVDSLKTSLSFLQQSSGLLNSEEAKKVTGSLQQVQQLQGKLQQSEQIKAFIRERKEQIKATLSRYTTLPKGLPGVTRILTKNSFIIPNNYRNTRTC